MSEWGWVTAGFLVSSFLLYIIQGYLIGENVHTGRRVAGVVAQVLGGAALVLAIVSGFIWVFGGWNNELDKFSDQCRSHPGAEVKSEEQFNTDVGPMLLPGFSNTDSTITYYCVSKDGSVIDSISRDD